MWSGTISCGRATMPSGNSGKSRTSSAIVAESTSPVFRRMTSTAIVWYRRDLRLHDHPALRAALDGFDRVVPVFVLDDAVLWTSDVAPYARARDARVTEALRAAGVQARPSTGGYCIDVGRPRTRDGR